MAARLRLPARPAFLAIAVAAVAAGAAACGWGAPGGAAGSEPDRPIPAERLLSGPPLGLELHRRVPLDNPLTPEKVALGRRLFFDPVFSADRSLACASCHRPELGFSDTLSASPGVAGRTGRRATPTLLNRTYGRAFFWDGRATSLETAVLVPISDPAELDLPLPALLARLDADPTYRRAFRQAFPEAPAVTIDHVAHALASFVRTLLSGDSPADRYAAGEAAALTAEEIDGRRIFFGPARCTLCHAGPNLTDEEFHNTGVAAGSGDAGRFAVTGRDEDRGRFKTPTLRGITRRPPFMHDGSVPTLEDVVEFYVGGGGEHPGRSRDLGPLRLTTEEKQALVAFLRVL